MQENTDLILYLILSCSIILLIFGVFLVVFFIKYNKNLVKKNNEALDNLILGQKSERARFARDLHDGLSPDLASIIFLIDENELNDPGAIEIQHQIKLRLRNAIQSIRRISNDLQPEILNNYGLVYSIKKWIQENSESGIQINFNNNLNEYRLNGDAELHLYKITQELIHNTQKHSQANAVNLSLNYCPKNNRMDYSYSDNGIGFDTHKKMEGTGMKNIEVRVALINGVTSIDGANGFKFRIVANTLQ